MESPAVLSKSEKQALYLKEYYQRNKEKIKAKYEANKEHVKQYYNDHKKELLEYQKNYSDANRYKIKNYQHDYYLSVTQKKRGHQDRVIKAPCIKETTKSPTAKAFRIIVCEVKPVEFKKPTNFLVSFD